MERMQNSAYFHARGACYTCLGVNDVVDTSVQIDGEGVLCICRSCIADLALTAGFALDDRSNEIKKLEMSNTRLKAEVAHYKKFQDTVRESIAEKV